MLWLSSLLIPLNAQAIESFQLTLAQVQMGDIRAQHLTVALKLINAQQLGVQLHIQRLHLPGVKKDLRNIRLSCSQLEETPLYFRCSKAQLSSAVWLAPVLRNIHFSYHKISRAIELKIPRSAWFDAPLSMTYTSDGRLALQVKDFNLEKSWTWLSIVGLLPDALKEQVLSGYFSIDLEAHLQKETQLKVTLKTQNLSFSNALGTQVGEHLNAELQLKAHSVAEQWTVEPQLTLHSGELYIEPLYIPLKQSLSLKVRFNWNTVQSRLQLHEFNYQHADIFQLKAQARVHFGDTLELEQAQLDIPRFSVPAVQQAYLQIWLEDQGWAGLRTHGHLSGDFNWKNEQGRLQVDAEQVDGITDQARLMGLSGTLHWHSQHARPTHLRWDSAQWGKTFSLPSRQLNLRLQGDTGTLLTALKIPVLDGALHIERLAFSQWLSASTPQFSLSGRIEPISMELLTHALGLPTLGGQLAAMVPDIVYHDQRLDMEGALLLQVFDGDIVVHHLSLQDPLGALPILNAAIDIKDLDLQTLTHFFEFGEISGRLSGYVKDLQLYKWQPIQFDAYVGTPKEGQGGKISQKAVSNLSNLGGGGMADVLSRGVLSFFESFSYQYLGLGCRLRNKVCAMRGVESMDTGYYLVKGGGLPRIDVKGFNPQVDWKVLVERLQNVTQLGTPEIR